MSPPKSVSGEQGLSRRLVGALLIAVLTPGPRYRAGVDGWQEVDAALERSYRLDSFAAAIAFVNRVAELAERHDHHPHIAISYRTVTIRWTTHSAGGVTDRDRELAGCTDGLLPG